MCTVDYDEIVSDPELKKAILSEKEITLKRLEVAKYWGFGLILSITKLSQAVFEAMDDIIVFCVKDENDIIRRTVTVRLP